MYGGREENWNLDPFAPPTSLVTIPTTQFADPQERCLAFSSSLTAYWESCTTSNFQAVLCHTSATRYSIQVPVQSQNVSPIDVILEDIRVDPTDTNGR